MCKIMEEVHNEGLVAGREAGRIEAFAEMVQVQVEDTGLTIEDAMDKLKVPDDIRSAVLDYIQGLEA